MDTSAVSAGTARWTAAARARESARSDRLFDDPWAAALAQPDGFAMLTAREPDGVANPYLPVRTRFFDDLIVSHSSWATQLVLLGAGHDTRAMRLPLPAALTVFALDQTDVLHRTEQVIAGARSARGPAPAWVPVAVDLGDAWEEPLLTAGFDRTAPTIWVAEGLLFHLAEAQVHALLKRVAELALDRSLLVADAFGSGLLDLPTTRGLVAHRTSTGRPLPFCTDAPEALLRASGWTPERVVEPGQAAANYGRMHQLPDDWDGGSAPTLRTYFMIGSRGMPGTAGVARTDLSTPEPIGVL